MKPKGDPVAKTLRLFVKDIQEKGLSIPEKTIQSEESAKANAAPEKKKTKEAKEAADKAEVERIEEAIAARKERIRKIRIAELALLKEKLEASREVEDLEKQLRGRSLSTEGGDRVEKLMLSFAEAPAKKAPVQKTPAQEIKKVAAPVQNFAKKRALAPTEEQALVSRKQQENETAIVGLQTRNGPVGKIKEMVNALSGGKGKGKVRPAEQDPQKGTVWAVGDREAVASIAEKSAQKGGAVAGEDELESFRKLFERLAKNENCPAWKREKLPGDLRDDGAQESFAPSEPGKDP